MKTYRTIAVTKSNQVATITMLFGQAVEQEFGSPSLAKSSPAFIHPELASVLTELREDDSVRVIVLTGSDGQFKVPAPKELYEKGGRVSHLADPTRAWQIFSAIIRCHQTMAEMEKPVVAKVNGDAIAFGSSIAFASDIIVAREDAKFMDHHMGGVFTSNYRGKTLQGGHEFSSVPGDGGLAMMPLFMTPCKAKEYLMLAQPYEARELARLGIINHAVPAAELDEKVDDIVKRLLARGAYALAWTKRVVNRRVVEHLNMVLDAGVAYEMVSFLQLEKLGAREKKTLD